MLCNDKITLASWIFHRFLAKLVSIWGETSVVSLWLLWVLIQCSGSRVSTWQISCSSLTAAISPPLHHQGFFISFFKRQSNWPVIDYHWIAIMSTQCVYQVFWIPGFHTRGKAYLQQKGLKIYFSKNGSCAFTELETLMVILLYQYNATQLPLNPYYLQVAEERNGCLSNRVKAMAALWGRKCTLLCSLAAI